MSFVEDPAHLSKTRLKSDLVAHNVALPPAASRKEVYVELHLKHVNQNNAANFSSDEDECVGDVTDKKDPEDSEMPAPSSLTDDDLKAALLKRGVKAGPIVATTRALYERKLQKLLQSNGQKRLIGAEKVVLYSDSEEEANQEEDDESRSEKQMPDQPDKTQEESSQNRVFYPQCFLPSSRLRACPPRNTESSSNWNSRNVLKSPERSQPHCSQISRTSSADHHTGLGSRVPPRSKSIVSNDGSSSSQSFSITQMMENRSSLSITDNEREFNGSNVQENQSQSSILLHELARDTFKDILPDSKTKQTEIFVTCRRPIKGAAQRPVQYAYPSSLVSPMTQRRRELERRLVPIHIQILTFLTIACVLYLIYINVEGGQNYWSDGDDRLLL